MFERLHTDRGLVHRVLCGHQDSFHILVDRYGTMIYGVAYAHVGNAQDAEDAVQEAFVRLYEWLDRLSKKESVAAWLVRVVRNISVDILRRRSRETSLEDASGLTSSVCPNPARTEIRRLVWEEMPSSSSEMPFLASLILAQMASKLSSPFLASSLLVVELVDTEMA